MEKPPVIQAPHRTRRSRKQWRAIVDQFEASGLSQRAFCEQAGISYGTFARWRRRLMIADVPQPITNTEGDLFVELSEGAAESGTPPSWDVELQLGHGVFLRLRHQSC